MLSYTPNISLLQNKTILITGAGGGIGREAAFTYARYGAKLILIGRTLSKLERVRKDIEQAGGKSVLVYECDLLTVTPEQCHEIAHSLSQYLSHLDGLLHNAGLLGVIAPMIKQPIALWYDVMQVNVNATVMLTQALLPLLLKSPAASLILTSSSVGKTARTGWGAYSISKFATEGLMQLLAEEYKDTHLRVNCINPGGTRTGMRAVAFPDENTLKLRTPAEIMPAYLFLMGDDSIGQTGTSIDAQPGRKPGSA